MTSVASAGTAEPITARILLNVVRAGSGTPARYSSTVFEAALPFAAGLRSLEVCFFIRKILHQFVRSGWPGEWINRLLGQHGKSHQRGCPKRGRDGNIRGVAPRRHQHPADADRKSTRLNSSHLGIS